MRMVRRRARRVLNINFRDNSKARGRMVKKVRTAGW